MPKNENAQTPESPTISEEAIEQLITPEMEELIAYPISVKTESGDFIYAQMVVSGMDAIKLFHERFETLKPVWKVLIDALEAKSKTVSSNAKSINEQVRNRIVEALSENDLTEISDAIRKVYAILDPISAKSDGHAIVIAERLAHLSELFTDFANDAIHLHDVPEDLKEQSSESLITLFNDIHSALKELQRNINAIFESFHANWPMYREFIDKKFYRLNKHGLPMHVEDGRALRSKFALDDNGDSDTRKSVAKRFAHGKLDITVGYKAGNAKEVVRNLATDYRSVQLALPSFVRELNTLVATKNKRPSLFPIQMPMLIHWIRESDTELAEKSDREVLNSDWTITIPNTDVVVRRIASE
jgi:effector-binding domain-containing protein